MVDNHYYVTCHTVNTTPDKVGKNVKVIDIDPTSFTRLSAVMNEINFSSIFIVMDVLDDVEYVLKNIALINNKIRIIVVNQWDMIDIKSSQDNITVIHTEALLSSHLYNQLPNVALIAQNIGLGQGEVMEVHVPMGSSYAYRHIGSIVQRKWKITGLYRNEKLILPTNATMIRPNDTLLIIGKPIVLAGVYKTINQRIGFFPEPFGKDIYLLLDFRYDKKHLLKYFSEVLYLLEKFKNKKLFVRVIYPNDFSLLEELKSYESHNITIAVSYENSDLHRVVEFDIDTHDIGLIINSLSTFKSGNLQEVLYHLKKLVYIFGEHTLIQSSISMLLMSAHEKMESISSTAFDISETLGLDLTLCDFDPDGDFKSKEMTIEHYETLTEIFNMEIKIHQKVSNPIRELSKMKGLLHIAPFEKNLNTHYLKTFISSQPKDFLLMDAKHPKLLVPFSIDG
ncbi:MAG: hypothetical protein Q9M36_06440 [Sulfurovum sp.]|nr:hypothetical protein [Sulfurovum sp.]